MRCGVISDIHGNLDALEAVLQHAGTLDTWVCLGDTVGYGPQPNECLDHVRRLCEIVLIGNHDLAALGQLDVRWFNPHARAAAEWTREALTPESITFLETLPETASRPEWNATFSHGALTDPPRDYITRSSEARTTFRLLETQALFIGHSHLSQCFSQEEGESGCDRVDLQGSTSIKLRDGWRYIINVGSVGQPRDLDPRAAYGILDLETRGVEVFRIEYDIESVQRKMADAELPPMLIERLTHGY